MSVHLAFSVNSKIYIKDPESSDIGKRIVKHSIELIYRLGFEGFTFKKLAADIGSTEATIYRYFENKHRLLLYIMVWYWHYMLYQIKINLRNIDSPETQLREIIKLLTSILDENVEDLEYNKRHLTNIVVSESSKVYLTRDVNEINQDGVFMPYKELCKVIATVIENYNPNYQYPKSLSSTLVEASHFQAFFYEHLPRLTDIKELTDKSNYTRLFLEDLCFRTLRP